MKNNKSPETFAFGKNWQKFLKGFDSQRLSQAISSIQNLVNKNDLNNVTFVDAGCGSGLFSLAAYKMGAKEIISFDVDQDAVNCTKELKNRFDNPRNWQVSEGSVLNSGWLNNLTKADIVYSWGVLHHTGDMWNAITNIVNVIKPGGKLVIAIYNEKKGGLGSNEWLKIKKFYSYSPSIIKKIMEGIMTLRYIFKPTFSSLKKDKDIKLAYQIFKSRFTSMSHLSRGMELKTDNRDWLGGLPYEFASTDQIINFCQKLNLELEKIIPDGGKSLGNNQFVFVKK